jgi:hypothetical protein
MVLLQVLVSFTMPKITWAQTVGANVVNYGCFTPGAFDAVPERWNVTAGSVDQLNTNQANFYGGVPQCACGYAIDLDGQSPGTIQQTVETTANHFYNVSYQLSGNFNNAFLGPAKARFTWGSFTWEESFNRVSTWSFTNMMYSLRYRIVDATGPSTVFIIRDISNSNFASGM